MSDAGHDDRTDIDEDISDDLPEITGGISILVTQAFCPAGHNLIHREEPLFSKHKGISIQVSAGDWSGEVVVSPFYGDTRIKGMNEATPKGTKCRLTCPICGTELPVQAPCGCPTGGDFHSLYLRTDLRESEQIMLCDVYGCKRSRVMDSLQVVSDIADLEDEA